MKKILFALNGILFAFPGINVNQNEIVITEQENHNNNVSDVVNINFANQKRLESIDGISTRIAIAIVEYRENNGFFKTIEQIQEVNGIGPATFEKIRNKISV